MPTPARRLVLLVPLVIAACGEEGATPPPATPAAPPPVVLPAPPPPAPTADDARRFMDRVEADLRRLWVARDRAGWVNQNFITDDTEALSAAGEEATAEYVARAILEARKFAALEATLPPDLARKFHLLRLAQTVPAPTDAKRRGELAEIESWMTGFYGKGQYCPPKDSPLAREHAKEKEKGKDACLKLGDLEAVLAKSHDEAVLREAWAGWHAVGAPMRDKYARYVELANEGAREIGFDDVGALWKSGFDMTPAEFEADMERLWTDVKPLYAELHCFMRSRLQKVYGKAIVPDHAPIPAHLLGNMWAQTWDHELELALPYQGEPSLDATKKLKDGHYDAKKMVSLGERFFGSLGFDPLPKSFWERSLFTRPKDRDVVCHASAWDVEWNGDLRIKMCIEPTEEDLVTIHHELGHDFYYQRYHTLPMLFQQGANDGFHEGIGDTIALSVTPAYLKSIGLLDATAATDHARLNQQMKKALEKIAFLPFGYTVDKWRWDVFSGKTPKDKYESSWVALRQKYQGVSAPVPRTEADFDPAAKFHVASSSTYAKYFLAAIYQFQFHRALCKAAGQTGPLDQCSIFGSKEAGRKLIAMLSLGGTKPWPDAMETVGAGRRADASAMLEYFAPLRKWLEDQNAHQACGW